MSAPARPTAAGECAHAYGPRVHLLDNPLLNSAVARLGAPETSRAELFALLRAVYDGLLTAALGAEWPRVERRVPTRMAAVHGERGVWTGPVLDPAQGLVVVDVIRGGIVPSQICFELLSLVLPASDVRLDHLNVARRSDESGAVVGADLTGSKIGGSVEGRLLVLPDPMGATGATTVRVIDHYLEHHGRPARIVALPMIATPEYLARVLDHSELVHVWTVRLDRGFSPPDVLASLPGERWAEERGLDDNGYIVPGAGGVGEVINNAWC